MENSPDIILVLTIERSLAMTLAAATVLGRKTEGQIQSAPKKLPQEMVQDLGGDDDDAGVCIERSRIQ